MTDTKPGVLITGAGTGIGAATASLFSRRGYPVVLVGRRKEKLEAMAKQLPGQSLVLPCDLTQPKEVKDLVSQATQKMELGILINNAGIFSRMPFEKAPDNLWREIFETNLFALVSLTREILPRLKDGSTIVNVASTAGLRPVAGMIPYVASKAAVIGFSQSLALELAPRVRVHCVCPGVVETPILGLEALSESEKADRRREMAKMHPLGRGGKPEDVAHAIFSLCAEGSEWMTGTVLPVDGGLSLT